MKCKSQIVWTLGCALAFACVVATAQEDTKAKNEERLKQLLKRYPEADANKDGVLTEAEAQAYRAKLTGKQPGKQRPQNNLPEPTKANVAYGKHERQVLDFWQAKSEKPTPVVVYIHGGGFVGGDKRTIPGALAQACLDAGISVAAIHYRFATTDIFPASQQDGARAIQFLRSKADEWNIAPTRMAAFGGSAGAGISMWLAFHDDMADPQSEDPVARQSTRLSCVGSMGGQTSYDPLVIKEWIGGKAYLHPSMLIVYGLKTEDQMHDPKLKTLYDEVSAIKHLTKDDPPILMFYNEADAPLPADSRPGQGIHHPIFGHKLKAEMDKLGIESLYFHASQRPNLNLEMLNFFKKHFKMS